MKFTKTGIILMLIGFTCYATGMAYEAKIRIKNTELKSIPSAFTDKHIGENQQSNPISSNYFLMIAGIVTFMLGIEKTKK